MMKNSLNQIFVTVGSTVFPKLIEQILEISTLQMLKSKGCKIITIQAGSYYSKVKKNILNQLPVKIIMYDYKDSIAEDIEKADLVISHAGAGTCLEVLRKKKFLLVVVNDVLMNNHQIELAEQLKKDDYVELCSTNTLHESLVTLQIREHKRFPSAKPEVFRTHLENFLLSDI